MNEQASRSIVFEIQQDGEAILHEARVEEASFPRSRLSEGQLVVEHSSGDYAISIDLTDGEYVANLISEAL